MSVIRKARVSVPIRSFFIRYGEPETNPILESTIQSPINPYGKSKLAAEEIILAYKHSQPLFKPAILRYFNVIGSDPLGMV